MNILTKICVIVGFVLLPLSSIAQPNNPDEDPDVPIAGIGYLLAAGAALGIKKIYDLRKRQ